MVIEWFFVLFFVNTGATTTTHSMSVDYKSPVRFGAELGFD